MAAAAVAARGSKSGQFGVHGLGRPGRLRAAQPGQDGQRMESFTLAQLVAASGVVGNSLANDVALWLTETGRGPADLFDGGIVQRKRDADHNGVILP
jgi:hypothetical protein